MERMMTMKETERIPELYGSRVFSDEIMRERLPKDVYQSLTRTIATGGELDASIAHLTS